MIEWSAILTSSITLILGLFVGSWWKKSPMETDYVQQVDCDKCNAKQRSVENQLLNQLSELRGIVLVIAMKVGISQDEITKLVK